MVLGIVSALVGGATFAWFTDSAVNQNNTFTAGTLTLDVNNNNSAANFDIDFNKDNLQPGDVITAGTDGFSTITVKNTGSLNAAVFGKFNVNGDLANDLVITDYTVNFFDANGNQKSRVDNFISNGTPCAAFLAQFGNKVTIKELADIGPLDAYVSPGWDWEGLKKDESYTITFKVKYDEASTVQGQTCNIGYEVKATQVNEQAIKALNLGYPTGGYDYDLAAYNYVKGQF